MATAKIDVKTDLHGSDKKLKNVSKQIKTSGDRAKTATSQTKNLWKQFALGALAVAGVSKAYKVLKDFVKDAIEKAKVQELAEKNLEASLSSTGRSAKKLVPIFKDYAKALQSQTRFGDEAIISAQSLLIQLTDLNDDGIKAATRGSIGLATVFGQDLQAATTLVAKALAGNFGALSRYGIMVTDVTGLEAKRAATLEQLEKLYQRAVAETDTFAGQLDQLKNVWGDLKEEVGNNIIESETFLGVISDLKDKIVELSQPENIEKVGKDIGVITGAINTGKDAWNFLTDKTGLASVLMGNLTGEMAAGKAEIILAAIEAGNFGEAMDQTDNTAAALEEQLALMRGEITEADLKFGIIGDTTDDVKDSLTLFGKSVFDADGNVKDLTTAFEDATTPQDLYKKGLEDAKKAAEDAKTPTDLLKDAIEDATDAFVDMPIDIEDVPGDINTLLDEIGFDDFAADSIEDSDGMKVDMIEDAEDIGEEWVQLATDIGNAFGNFFTDVVTKGKTFKESLDDLWGGIKTAFVNMVADMITEWVTGFVLSIVTSSPDAVDAIDGITDSLEGEGGSGGLIGAIGDGTKALAGTAGSGGMVGALYGVAFAVVFVGGLFDLLFNTFGSLNEHWEEQRKAMMDQRDAWIEYGLSIGEANDRIREFIDLSDEASKTPEFDPERGKGPSPGTTRPGTGRPGGIGAVGPGIGGFADGGIAMNKQLAFVAERGPEAMIPVDQLLDAISNKGNNGNINITLQIDGQRLTEFLSPHIEEQARLGNILTEQQNFVRTET